MENDCWHNEAVIDQMNEFYQQHKENSEVTKHLTVFTRLLEIADENNCPVLDIGAGTGSLCQYLPDNSYVGADLPHIISGCAMKNFPNNLYRVCDIQTDDLKWVSDYKIIVMNGFIDVMPNPIECLTKVLLNSSKFVILHRQEITEKGLTHTDQRGSYGGITFHSIISRSDFVSVLEKCNFQIVKELSCGFGNWENGGSSFLLRKRESWALDLLDHKLNSLLFTDKKTKGFFIEAGAGDGKEQTNTFYFEFYRDWRGLLIEPVTPNYHKCVENRSPNTIVEHCALVSDQYNSDTIDIYNTVHCRGLMSVIADSPKCETRLKLEGSGTAKRITVPALSLNKVLEKHKYKIPEVIDVLILDVETYELEVLKGIDFDKWNISYLVIEELYEDDSIRLFLDKWYSFHSRLTERDSLYKRKNM